MKVLTAVEQSEALKRYLAEARRFPLLEPETERTLALRWREKGDRKAADRLLASHLRLAVKFAWAHAGYGLPLEDLIAEGNIGLLRALDRFDPDRGARFATYASWWIRAAMQEYVLRRRSLVRIGTTAAQKRLFFHLHRLKAAHNEVGTGDMPPETVRSIATILDVSEAEVVEMNRRLSFGETSLNTPIGEDSEDQLQDRLIDPSADPEEKLAEAEVRAQQRKRVRDALAGLNPRERHIFVERRLSDEGCTLKELGATYGISRERVRQIECRALEKVRRAILGEAGLAVSSL